MPYARVVRKGGYRARGKEQEQGGHSLFTSRGHILVGSGEGKEERGGEDDAQ